MMTKKFALLITIFIVPAFALSQDGSIGYFGDSLNNAQSAITNLYYTESRKFVPFIKGVSNILAIGIFLYFMGKILGPLMRAEPIIWAELFRPVLVFFCVLAFPVILNLVEVCLSPISGATESMTFGSHKALLDAQKEAYKKNPDYLLYIGDDGNGNFDKYVSKYGSDMLMDGDIIDNQINKLMFSGNQMMMKRSMEFKLFIYNLLNLFYQTAILCLNFIRTFYLIVIAILGPIAFAISLIPGMGGAPSYWLTQFVSKWLWLPIANVLATLLNSVQLQLIQSNIDASADFFSAGNIVGLIFMIIGIVSFFCVPSLASMAMQVGGASAGSLASKASSYSQGKINQTSKSVKKGGAVVLGGASGLMKSGASSAFNKIKGTKPA